MYGLSVHPPSPLRILVVASTPMPRRLLRASLAPSYHLRFVTTLDDALSAIFSTNFDLIVIETDPAALRCEAVGRELSPVTEAPIVALSATHETQGAVRALEVADDYIALPMAPEEVAARLGAATRCPHRRQLAKAAYDDRHLAIDLERRTVTVLGEPVALTAMEFRLLAVLVRHRGAIVTHGTLIADLWGSPAETDTHALRLQVARLRRKLASAGPYLVTHRGLGYAFTPPAPGRRAAAR